MRDVIPKRSNTGDKSIVPQLVQTAANLLHDALRPPRQWAPTILHVSPMRLYPCLTLVLWAAGWKMDRKLALVPAVTYWRKLKDRSWEQRTCSNGDILQEYGEWPIKVLQLQSDGWADASQLDEKTMSFRPIGLISFERLAKAQAQTDWQLSHKAANLPPKDLVRFSLVRTDEIDDALEEGAAWDRLVLRFLTNVVGASK